MSAPVCDICGSVAPYGDERNLWIGAHTHRIKRFIKGIRGGFKHE